MSARDDSIAVTLFSEIMVVDQLARARIVRALPRGMELSHFSVLNHLAHTSSERSPAQLARLFHVTKGAMTNTLGKLELAGYVHIRPDWDDARRKCISISKAGILARDDAIRAIAPVLDEIIDNVGPAPARAALPFLRSLRTTLEIDE